MPLDQDNKPDRLLTYLPRTDSGAENWINVAVALYLGDVSINPEAIAMGMKQKFYYAPMAQLRSDQIVLDAARDVIRANIMVKGNSRLWIIPDEQQDCDAYTSYLQGRNWWV